MSNASRGRKSCDRVIALVSGFVSILCRLFFSRGTPSYNITRILPAGKVAGTVQLCRLARAISPSCQQCLIQENVIPCFLVRGLCPSQIVKKRVVFQMLT